ncbi:uncharacterized protein LOC130569863 [Triplophysa rosa]|uniref:uncharacterized protein LOC130569863 n=1 Tax=Triplophysa rosa TaxID=992332 RepID=UPI002545FEC9|nr:uncharacterized protein LOC130569863 [Triplophysa rosa]
MGPQLHFSSTYAEEFSYPARGKPTQPRLSSAYRRNNPHPRPDFLMPRQLQTGYGSRRHYQTTTPTSFLPPVRHISVQFPDVQTGESMQSSQKDSKARASTAVCTLPPAGWHLKPQRTDIPHSSIINTQGKYLGKDHIRSQYDQKMDVMPALKNIKHQVTHHHRRSRSNSTPDCSKGHSCFQVVKPYKVGHYIIHPEFLSEGMCY